jgi:rRNA maturation RNase YbeY
MEGCAPEEINYIFCSDEYLFKLNNAYLKHKTYTDIITFQYSWPPQLIRSDIYISVERVRENAKLYNTSFLNELYRVMFHGALHLCGYKDKTKRDMIQMRSKENFYLNLYVPRGIK